MTPFWTVDGTFYVTSPYYFGVPISCPGPKSISNIIIFDTYNKNMNETEWMEETLLLYY